MECHEDLYKLNCPLICKKKKKSSYKPKYFFSHKGAIISMNELKNISLKKNTEISYLLVSRFMVFNATFNNISVWR
jgi:hypothetical protein